MTRRLRSMFVALCLAVQGCAGPTNVNSAGRDLQDARDPIAATTGIVVEKIGTLPGLEAVSDAAWLPPDQNGEQKILFLGLRGSVIADASGQHVSELITPRFEGDMNKLGFGATYHVVRRPDGSILAMSHPGLGGRAVVLWDPLTGRVLWTFSAQNQLVIAAPLRSAKNNQIVTALAEEYGRGIVWLDETGTIVATTADKQVYMANAFGQFAVTDFDRDGNDELLFGTHYPFGSSQILGLAQADGTLLWSGKAVEGAIFLQNLRLGDGALSANAPLYVTGVSSVDHGIFGDIESVYFRGTCERRDGQWTGTWTRISKGAKWCESERNRSIKLSVHESSDHLYVSGNSPDMSSCFRIRLSDQGGYVDRTVLLCRKNVTKRALNSTGGYIPGNPAGTESDFAIIGFGEDMYRLKLVRNVPDSLP